MGNYPKIVVARVRIELATPRTRDDLAPFRASTLCQHGLGSLKIHWRLSIPMV